MEFTRLKIRVLTCALAGSFLLAHAVYSHAENAPDGQSLYLQGSKMLFSMYSLIEPQLSNAKMGGLTAIGPYYGKTDLEKALNYSHSAQLPILYTAGPHLDFETMTGIDVDAELEILRHDIVSASKHPEIAGWALANEELRYWRKAEMTWLQLATEVIRDNDPQNRPIMMYEPNHRSAEALIKTSQYLDVVAKGTYANYVGMKYKRTWVRWSIEQAVAAAAATGTTPLAILWMARDQDNEADIASIPKWTRHDVYLSLITGAKGIIVFSGWKGRKGFQQHFQHFYNGYVAAARELNGDLDLASVFLRGEKKNSVSLAVIDGPTLQTFEFRDTLHEYPTVSSAQFTLNGKNHLFVVNSAESKVTVRLDGLPQDAAIINTFTGDKVPDIEAISLDRIEVLALTW